MSNERLIARKENDTVNTEAVNYLKVVLDKTYAHKKLSGILVITSYPPRECGIATYSKDLITSLKQKFNHSFSVQVCAVKSDSDVNDYCDIAEVKYILNTDCPPSFSLLAESINSDTGINVVLIQHEYGFYRANPEAFYEMLKDILKPVMIVLHTVLPSPDEGLRKSMQEMVSLTAGIIVMTKSSAKILVEDYGLNMDKISIIPHGTHLVHHMDKNVLKETYHLSGRKVISTFGLLSSGKSIETTIAALPNVINEHPDVLFLIIGKTHPSVYKAEGEKYRSMLEEMVISLHLQDHVMFINSFLPLTDLLNYLQLTDIYVFTSKDPNQAVSGTFSYAISCGCPIISTAIPHAREVLKNDAGIIIDFENSSQLSAALNKLLDDELLRNNMSNNVLHRMAATCWENSANKHALLIKKIDPDNISLQYSLPPTNLAHIKKMTTSFGILQFSKTNHPDINSGYTLDDNARALIAICQNFVLTKNWEDIEYISIYLKFISFCQQPQGNFKNYVNNEKQFTIQNNETNLDDSNGRAIWALGYLISLEPILPLDLIVLAKSVLANAMYSMIGMHSTRAMAFCIKGLYYANSVKESLLGIFLIRKLANRLVQMYRHESSNEWEWFESYLTYANCIVPEALLCAWSATKQPVYLEIAKKSFDFLLSNTFRDGHIKVISNKGWLQKGNNSMLNANGGEQPIDVAYTIIALAKFYKFFKQESYLRKMQTAFQWFLGDNHLHQIIYNPCTGGCYDGLEENYINLNQGAESVVSYLMAKLTIDEYSKEIQDLNLYQQTNPTVIRNLFV
ncbi:MAG: glycosyltransferase [Chitinophagaceae bacterium]|nr:glycosyltransferase [Chitinophagaceae bacterium]